jgi:ABC-2 type transport system permease protein
MTQSTAIRETSAVRPAPGMMTQFLRLKLRLLANIFRRSPWQVVGIILGLIYGLGLAGLLFVTLVGLRFVGDVEIIRAAVIVGGSAIVVGFIVFPLVFGVDDTMDPRRFALFGISDRSLAFGLGLAALIGVPALVLGVVLLGTVITWSRGFGETLLAILGAALAFATCLLLARVATAVASLLLATRRAREFSGVLGLLLIVALSPVIVVLVSIDWAESGLAVLEGLADVLSWTPLGAAFAVPADAAVGAWGAAVLKLLIAAATLGLLWLAWQRLVAVMLVTPGREGSAKSYRGLGWFDRLPHTPAGAIAARSLTYWFRDARYWVSFIMIPVVPVLVMVPLSIAGVPMTYLPLIPVPLMALFLGWSLHNDTAYDSTAIWLHVVSGVRGAADRFGRLVPVLVAGVLVIGLGSAITALVLDDWRMVPSVIGVSTALLLAGLGVGAVSSARFPYPAVKPGDSPFQQPQATGTISALVQSITMFGSILVAAPAIVFAVLGIFVDPEWHLLSLVSGVVLGVAALVWGIWLGGRVFERRGPEILQAAVRA